MAVTLAQAKLNVQTDLEMGVIDEFRKSSYLLDNMTFHDAVSPVGGGATLTYGYTRILTQPTANFRAINSEYTPQEVTKQPYSVDLKVFGGSYQVDRIVNDLGGIVSEVQLQSSQKIKAATALFHDTVINGDSGVNANAFDGIDKAVTGSSTEYNASGTEIDLSTSATMDTNWKVFLDALDEFLSGLDGIPVLLGNTKLITKIKSLARRAGSLSQMDMFGGKVDSYNGSALIDLGQKPGSNSPIVSIDGTTGNTSLYAGRLGLDGLHGVSLKGQSPVKTFLPDFSTPGAVKTGEVEMVAAIALKASKAAGVFRKLKVQ